MKTQLQTFAWVLSLLMLVALPSAAQPASDPDDIIVSGAIGILAGGALYTAGRHEADKQGPNVDGCDVALKCVGIATAAVGLAIVGDGLVRLRRTNNHRLAEAPLSVHLGASGVRFRFRF